MKKVEILNVVTVKKDSTGILLSLFICENIQVKSHLYARPVAKPLIEKVPLISIHRRMVSAIHVISARKRFLIKKAYKNMSNMFMTKLKTFVVRFVPKLLEEKNI